MRHRFIAKRHWNDVPTAMSGEKVYDEDLISLTFGDPDFNTSELIINPTFEDVRAGHTHYNDCPGYAELRDDLAKIIEKDSGFDSVARSEIYITNGAGHGLWLALESILDPGDEVIIHQPSYTPYPDQIRMAGGVPVPVETYEKDGFQMDPALLESRISNRTKAILINNPSNPTGAAFTRENLESIAALAKKYDLVVIADEVYAVLSYGAAFIPFASLEGMRERTITLCSASKEFAMTGWRVGYNFAPDFIIHRMTRVNENDSIMASSIAQRAYIHALKNRETIHRELREAFKERMEYSYSRIKEMKNISVLYPAATFYLFVNIKETGLSSEEVADKILNEAKVSVFPGNAFGNCGEGYLRIACTQDLGQLKLAFDRISQMEIFK